MNAYRVFLSAVIMNVVSWEKSISFYYVWCFKRFSGNIRMGFFVWVLVLVFLKYTITYCHDKLFGPD